MYDSRMSDTTSAPTRVIEGADAAGVEWYVADVSRQTGDMSLTQLARVLEAVQDEIRWRHEQIEEANA